VSQLSFEAFQIGDRFRSPSRTLTDAHTLRVTLTNQRGEMVLEGQPLYLIAYRPAA
jgi:hypothetical protein